VFEKFTSQARTKAMVTAGLAVSVIVIGLVFLLARDDEPHGDTTIAENQSLSEAVAAGNIDIAQSQLIDGADPDEPRLNGFTPLMRAAIRDDVPMVKLLLDAGADLEATSMEGLTVSHMAAQRDAAAALDTLIAAGADLGGRSRNGMNTLDHAAATGSVDTLQAIVNAGIDVDEPSEIITQGHGYPVDTGSTALGIAARAGHVETMTALLSLGASVDGPSAAGQTPLLMAIFSGQPPEVVSLLLDAGADPTVRASCLSGCSFEEGDALTWAHRLGDPDVIPILDRAIAAWTG
jgi:ankyrin repeat protein